MKEVPQKLRTPYAQDFVPRGCRNMRMGWFLDEGAVMIGDIEPDEAPVAYRVQSKSLPLDPGGLGQYVIRSFEGKLWWPLSWPRASGLHRKQFAYLAAEVRSPCWLPTVDLHPSAAMALQGDRGIPGS